MDNLILKLGEFIWFFGWGLLGGYICYAIVYI